MKVVFLGNHTVGISSLEAIAETCEIKGVIAHPPDIEDGVKYKSVYNYAFMRGWNVIRGKAKDLEVKNFISAAKPDLIWVTDYRYLLPVEIIRLPIRGVVNMHPSLLPKYRGRASINWAILKGETRIGLTAHFVDEGIDTGDIIEQKSFILSDDQDVGDALNMLYPLYRNITRNVLDYIRDGHPPRRQQDLTQGTCFPRRRPEDGQIDWSQPARTVRNLIRAVARPYPGAFTFHQQKKIIVWSSELGQQTMKAKPGEIIEGGSGSFTIQVGDGTLLINDLKEAETNLAPVLKPGDKLV